jgi:hypothetical protein
MSKMRIEFPDARPDSTGGYLCHPDDAGNSLYIYTEDDTEPPHPKRAITRVVVSIERLV